MAGFCGCVSVSAETVSGLKAILGGLSLGRGIPFPRCRSILDEDLSPNGSEPNWRFRHSPSATAKVRADQLQQVEGVTGRFETQ